MAVRVQTFTKKWLRAGPEALEVSLQELGAEIPRVLAWLRKAKKWTDTRRDPVLTEFGNRLWRLGERIRRGEKVVYLAVVKDIPGRLGAKRRNRTKVLRSFGRETSDARMLAENFAAAYEAAVNHRRQIGQRSLFENEKEIFWSTFGLVLGTECLRVVIDGGEEIFGGKPGLAAFE